MEGIFYIMGRITFRVRALQMTVAANGFSTMVSQTLAEKQELSSMRNPICWVQKNIQWLTPKADKASTYVSQHRIWGQFTGDTSHYMANTGPQCSWLGKTVSHHLWLVTWWAKYGMMPCSQMTGAAQLKTTTQECPFLKKAKAVVLNP